MTKKQPDTTHEKLQFSFRYDGARGDKLVGYAYATRRKPSDVLREAVDEYYEKHKDVIHRRQV